MLVEVASKDHREEGSRREARTSSPMRSADVSPVGSRTLHQLAGAGELQGLRAALDAGVDVNIPAKDGLTALMAASLKGADLAVALLLESGADPNRKLPNGFTALLFACAEGHTGAVCKLLAAGADVNARTHSGENALWFAADRGAGEVIERLLASGVSTETRSANGSTPLHLSAFARDERGVRALLAAGVDVRATMNDGTDALMCAAQSGSLGCVVALLEAGADAERANRNGATALHLAAMCGHLEVVGRLLEAGASVHARTKSGESVVAQAALGNHLAVLQRLCDAGADVTVGGASHETPLFRACAHPDGACVPLLLSLSKGVAVDAATVDGVTPLMMAAKGSTSHVVGALLDAGAVPTATDKEGRTALHFAAGMGRAEIVRQLLAAGADPFAKTVKGQTSADFAGTNTEVRALLPVSPGVPAALLERVRSGTDETSFGEAAEWLEANRTRASELIPAAVAGALAAKARNFEGWSVGVKASELLMLCGHTCREAAQVILGRLEETVREAMQRRDSAAVKERLEVTKDVLSKSVRVVDPTSGRKRYATLEPLFVSVSERWMGLAEGTFDWPAASHPAKAAEAWKELFKAVDPGQACKPRFGRFALRAGTSLDVPFGHSFDKALLARLLPADQVIVDLVAAFAAKLEAIPHDKLQEYGGNPRNVAGYAWLESAWKELRGYADHGPLTATTLPVLSQNALENLAYLIPEVAGAAVAEEMSASPVVHAVLRRLHEDAPTHEALFRLRVFGARIGALPADCVPAGAIKTLPPSLPTTLAGVVDLAAYLEVAPDPGDRDHVAAMVGRILAVARAHGGEPQLSALASGHIDEMEEWVAIHQRQVGDADYSVPKHYSDARPHLPTKGLICIGRNSCTDYYFIDPRARTADGTCPVLLYLHEVAFACDVVAPSVASFAGYEVARMWAERECASHLAKRLQPQKTAVAAIDRD